MLLALAVAAPSTNGDWSPRCSGSACPQENCDGSHTVRNASVQKPRTLTTSVPTAFLSSLFTQNTNGLRASRAGSAPGFAPGLRPRTNVPWAHSSRIALRLSQLLRRRRKAQLLVVDCWADSTVPSWQVLATVFIITTRHRPYRAACWRSGGGGDGVTSCGARASPAGGFDAVGCVLTEFIRSESCKVLFFSRLRPGLDYSSQLVPSQ